MAHRFQLAFRYLGHTMGSEGLLPDADLAYFFTTSELPAFIANPSPQVAGRPWSTPSASSVRLDGDAGSVTLLVSALHP